jgi:glycosyltransferase involved in cell wall biosynthesis
MRVIDPLYWATVLRASAILVLTKDVSRQFPLRLLPAERFLVEPAIAVAPLPEQSQTPNVGCEVLYVGKFLYIKCAHLVIDAFARAARDRDAMRLTMIGSGPEEPRLRAQIAELGLEHRVTFAGWLSRAQVLDLMGHASMLLFPSAEGAGMVVLEAMVSGLPVVCLDLGGPGQMVAPQAGIRVPVGSYDQMVGGLAGALHRLCDDPALRSSMSAGARHHVGTRYAWDGKQRALDAAYALALGHHRDVERE